MSLFFPFFFLFFLSFSIMNSEFYGFHMVQLYFLMKSEYVGISASILSFLKFSMYMFVIIVNNGDYIVYLL